MKRTIVLLAAAAAVVAAGGLALAVTWHLAFGTGLYCSVGTATTVGCDPSLSAAGQVAVVLVMLVAIPLLAAVFARLTGHHASKRVAGQVAAQVHERVTAIEKRLTEEADKRHVIMQRHIERVVAGHCADVMHHVSVVADGPAKGGAGSNPAKSEGLPAETAGSAAPAGPVVPPPATPNEAHQAVRDAAAQLSELDPTAVVTIKRGPAEDPPLTGRTADLTFQAAGAKPARSRKPPREPGGV
jgi:hypothetical protein